jgi:hypothetical protein
MEYILIRHNPLFSVIGHGLNTGIPGTVLVGLELITGRKNIRLYFVMGTRGTIWYIDFYSDDRKMFTSRGAIQNLPHGNSRPGYISCKSALFSLSACRKIK